MPQRNLDDAPQPTGVPRKKVVAAAGGAGVGAAATILICWIYSLAVPDHPIPDAVQAAVGVLVSAMLSFAAGYYTSPDSSESTLSDGAGKGFSAR